MQEILNELTYSLGTLSKIILSSLGSVNPEAPEKISVQKIKTEGDAFRFSAEERRGKQAFHKNLDTEEMLRYVEEKLTCFSYRQVNLFTLEGEIAFRISKKGKITKTVNRKAKPTPAKESHNREKQYLIREGDAVPFLVDLGIFTQDYKIVRAKYDKFRQINRFIELVDHAFADFPKEEISVLDFGCGKSYLTFFLYYYFAVLRGKRVHITGYDLKEDVVDRCNDLAKKYGYHGLKFLVADVTKDRLSEETIDFVISLHACDTATDYALQYALNHQVPYVFSVPCCQHQVAAQIHKGGELDLFLSHGIFKDRMCALLTDAIRTRVLEAEGYRVDVLEFVDFAHSPKNIMLRAKKTHRKNPEKLKEIAALEEKYGFRQTLYHLRQGETL